MQVPGWDVLAVLLGHHLKRFVARAVLALVVEECGLRFPVLDRLGVFAAAGGVAVEERELRRLERPQRGLEEHGLDTAGVFLIFLLGVLPEESEAARIGADDTEAAAGAAILLLPGGERGGDMRLPQPHAGLFGELVALDDLDRVVIDTIALGPLSGTYGSTPWLVYACSDNKSLVFVALSGSPAAPFYFMLTPKNGKYSLVGEGNGSKVLTDRAYAELTKLSAEDVTALVRAAQVKPRPM